MENSNNNTAWLSWPIVWRSIMDTFVILLFTLQPTIYFCLNNLRLGQSYTFDDTFKSGDVLLYCISFLSASYLVYNDARIKVSDWKDNINKFILGIMFIISMIYAMMKGDNRTTIEFARYTSIVFITISFIVFLRSQILARTPTTDVAETRREEQQNIEDHLS